MNHKFKILYSLFIILILYSSFLILDSNSLTREPVNSLIINKAYATEPTQAQLAQTASILSSIQNIINKLKREIQELFGKKVKAATETIGLVRQDCTGYTNCYTSLSAWEAAYGGISFGACAQGDLVCADKVAIAQIDGAWTNPDTTAVTIDGWTTDATHYIKIYTTTAARHNGKWDTGKYRLNENITIKESFARIEGMQMEVISNVGGWNVGIFISALAAGNSDIYISDNIIRQGASTAGDLYGIRISDANSITKISNNIIYGFRQGYARGGYI